ncbi:MAG: PAS domain S-box protein [Treponemataceae bacterium]
MKEVFRRRYTWWLGSVFALRTVKVLRKLDRIFAKCVIVLVLNFSGLSILSAETGEKPLLFLGNRNLAPVVYNKDGRPTGLAVDIVKAIEQEIKRPITVLCMDWTQAQEMVARGEADALIQINPTEERKRIYDFSDPLLQSQFSIFTRNDRVGITGAASLRGLRVGVENNGLPHRLLKEDKAVQLALIPNFLNGFGMLNDGTLDAVVVDFIVGSYVLAENHVKGIRIVGEPIAYLQSAIAVGKGNAELLTLINKGLKEIRRTGTYSQILRKWEPKEVVFLTKEQIWYRYYLHIIGVLIVFCVIVIAWTITVHRELKKRKATEALLRERSNELEMFFSTSLDLFCISDSNGRFIRFNKRWEETLGYSIDEFTDHPFVDHLHPDDREASSETFAKLKSNQSILNCATRFIKKDGSFRWIEWRASPVGNRIYISARDITERKEAAAALRESETNYKRLLDMVQEGIWAIDKDSITTFVNPRMAEILGCSPEDMLGRPLFSFMDEQGKKIAELNVARRKNGVTEQHDFEFIRKDGARIYTRLETGPIFDAQGQYAGAIAAVADISAQRRMEEERRAHLRFFENLDRINRAIQSTTDLEQMMGGVLDIVLSIFDCDRTLLMYPCDPEAASWRVPMERTKPSYSVAQGSGLILPMDAEVAEGLRLLLNSEGPVKFGPGSTNPLPQAAADRFGFKTYMAMALYPRSDKPWQFGVYQCSHARSWTSEEERLLLEIGRRLADGLTSLLSYRDLIVSEEKLRRLNDELEERVTQRTAELEKKNKELERANRVFVGRELRMLELKKKIKALESRSDKEKGK